jgi:hypothetical protein
VQQGLALPLAAGEIARLAVALDLAHVPANGFPALDLARVLLGQAAAQIVAAIPLEPAARIVRMDPALAAPFRERLAGVDAEIIQRAVARFAGKLSAREPGSWKFLSTIGQVFAAKHTEAKHFSGRQLRPEFGIEIAARG